MNTGIGLWIDHRKAVIAIVSDEREQVKEITFHMEKHARFSSAGSEDGSSDGVGSRTTGTKPAPQFDEDAPLTDQIESTGTVVDGVSPT